MKEIEDKNSMLYWYPLIEKLLIPQPETICVRVNPAAAFEILDGAMYPQLERFQEAVTVLGLPVFIRTDQLSGKHNWKNTCFLDRPQRKELERHIRALVDETLGCDVFGKLVSAFFFRKYISMDSKYTAFWGDMPVNSERRYFIENGRVLCHHPYWIEEAIIKPSKKNWRRLSREMNQESNEEIALLTRYAEQVSKAVRGFWSVDFCRSLGGDWYLIDMAIGENSWHPKDCPNNRTRELDIMKMMVEQYKQGGKLPKIFG
jgi:hypothetical protein